MITFFVHGLLRCVVAVSTDPVPESALPHPSSRDQPASYREPIVQCLLGVVRKNMVCTPLDNSVPHGDNRRGEQLVLKKELA